MKDINNDISKHISYNIDCKVLIELILFIKETKFKNLHFFEISKDN